MSITRRARIASQLERVANQFDQGTYSRGRLAQLADVPESSIHSLMTRLRSEAQDREHVPSSLSIGGEWIYGWAVTLHEHQSEHYKRRKRDERRLVLDVKLLTQSVADQPEAANLRYQLVSANNRLSQVRLEIDECAKALGVLQTTIAESGLA